MCTAQSVSITTSPKEDPAIISNLMVAHFRSVFNQRDCQIRASTIQYMYHEDFIWFKPDPIKGDVVVKGRKAFNAELQAEMDMYPGFQLVHDGHLSISQNHVAAHWNLGPPGVPDLIKGAHYLIIENGKVKMLSDGSNFPCRGALKALGTVKAKPVASWTAGEKYNLTIFGGAPHGGGSCQASISSDQGKSFTVIHTWSGGCPGLDGPNSFFDFQLPSDTPNGEVIFAWTWFNKLGNREMYMNCASVEITGSSSAGETVAFKDRPAMFVANVNGCKTVDSKDVKIPNPGPDVTESSSDEAPPVGDCDKATAGSGSWTQSAAQSSPAGRAIPTSAPSGSDEGNNGSGDSAEPTPTAGGAFVTAFPSIGSNPSSSTEDPNQKGSDSGNSGFVLGNDWPAGFSGAKKTHVNPVGLALISLFVLVVII